MPRSLGALGLCVFLLSGCASQKKEFAASAIAVPPEFNGQERFLPPEAIVWSHFRNADGANIRYSHVPVAGGAKATALVVTGHTEFGEKYFELMRELHSRGIEIWQMDWRGYGGSDHYSEERERASSLGIAHDIGDLHQFATEVVKPSSGSVFLVAHSMGGNISLRYLYDHPDTFAFAVIGSPFLSMGAGSAQALPDWVVRGVIWGSCLFGLCDSWAKGSGPWADKTEKGLSHDPERSEVQRNWFRANPALRVGGVTNRWVREYIRSHDVLADGRNLGAIRTPVLLGTATEDPITRSDVHINACSQMPNCTLSKSDGAWHELFMEADDYRGPWMSAVYAFMALHNPQFN